MSESTSAGKGDSNRCYASKNADLKIKKKMNPSARDHVHPEFSITSAPRRIEMQALRGDVKKMVVPGYYQLPLYGKNE